MLVKFIEQQHLCQKLLICLLFTKAGDITQTFFSTKLAASNISPSSFTRSSLLFTSGNLVTNSSKLGTSVLYYGDILTKAL